MITVISPAKSMDLNNFVSDIAASELQRNSKTSEVLQKLKSLSVLQIAKLMHVSSKIAELNYQRFQEFESLPEKQAIFAYTGDVYKNIDVQNLSAQQLEFSQVHFRIISALYGLLLPLDKIKAYRLEMSCRLPGLACGAAMSEFWKEELTKQLRKELGAHKKKFLINLASNEYFAAIDKKNLGVPVINIHFREVRNGGLRNIAINSKRARGMMSDYIIKNRIDAPDGVKSFDSDGYQFDSSISDEDNFFFVKR